MPTKEAIELSDADLLTLQQGVYGEMAGASDALVKMAAQSALNRMRSGRSKEFGSTMPEIMQRGYYAVSNPNKPYQEAVSGKFGSPHAKSRWGEVKKLIDIIMSDADYGDHQFYFTDDEVKRLREKNEQRASQGKAPAFNFDAVKPRGLVEGYQLYGY